MNASNAIDYLEHVYADWGEPYVVLRVKGDEFIKVFRLSDMRFTENLEEVYMDFKIDGTTNVGIYITASDYTLEHSWCEYDGLDGRGGGREVHYNIKEFAIDDKHIEVARIAEAVRILCFMPA